MAFQNYFYNLLPEVKSMINVALIERNETHRESLATLLSQLNGLKVVHAAADGNWIHNFTGPPIHLKILDGSMGQEQCLDLIRQSSSLGMKVKTLILLMFREELDHDFATGSVMLKSAGKSEFEGRIRQLMTDYIAEP